MDRGARRPKDFTAASLSGEIVKCRSRLKTLHSNLERAVEVVGDLRVCASNKERIEKVKEGIQCGNVTQLADFTMQLLKVLLAAKISFQEAEKAIKEIRSLCIELATVGREKTLYAKSQKEVVRLVGGTATTGGIGVGVMATSAVVEHFEMGDILNHVTLYVYLSAAMVGLALAYTTYLVSSNFERQERELRELSQSLDKLMSSSSSIRDFIQTIKGNLESVSGNIDTVDQAREALEEPSCLVSAFDHLCQKICSLGVSTYQKQLKAMNKDLQE